MNILITNDDGIRAEGIAVLARAAKAFGKVTVVAPASQCSAMSHRITLGRGMTVESYDFPVEGVEAYMVDGTPADCIRAALDAILPEKPDVVLSGINYGYNIGYDIVYSGTVSAAMEALMSGVPAIALSRNSEGSFTPAAEAIGPILEKLIAAPPSPREIWNVNFPGIPAKGILWNRTVAHQSFFSERLYTAAENGRTVLQYPETPAADNAIPRGDESSDLRAVTTGYISVGTVSCPVL